uniref:Zygote arrest 1 n=1 Tax=Cynoglossus semilaevis TaxID=244447 RepID=A0A3P8X1P9_CYNSE
MEYYYSYNPYSGRYTRGKEAAWKYKSYLSHYGDASEAFSNQQRAQLKSILSQINPKLTPRLRKANTKDVAVQVNPRKDASVQCSIGPRTLLSIKRDFRRKGQQETASPSGGGSSNKQAAGVRYPRTLAVYSPVAYRSVTSFLVDDNNNEDASCGQDHGQGKRGKKMKVSLQKSQNSKQKQAKSGEDVPSFFLEQKYGYYHCRECNLRWESAYVWCVQGTNKVYFKQFCRKCQKEFNPYRVEDITCHTCNKARCSCAITQRHVDPKRPHRQDLCGRCKGKRLSCDSTFSFKYII